MQTRTGVQSEMPNAVIVVGKPVDLSAAENWHAPPVAGLPTGHPLDVRQFQVPYSSSRSDLLHPHDIGEDNAFISIVNRGTRVPTPWNEIALCTIVTFITANFVACFLLVIAILKAVEADRCHANGFTERGNDAAIKAKKFTRFLFVVLAVWIVIDLVLLFSMGDRKFLRRPFSEHSTQED